MIRYTLEDKGRQEGLEKAFPGFGEDLQAAGEREFDDRYDYVEVPLSDCGGVLGDYTLPIAKTAIRTEEVYDPHAWNNFPQVTPPEGVPMRVEGHYKASGFTFSTAMCYQFGKWYPLITVSIPLSDLTIDRFRPWDEDEE